MNPAPPIAMISDPTRSFVPGTTPRTVVVAVAMAKPSSLVVRAACTDRERRRVPHGASCWGTPYALDEGVPRSSCVIESPVTTDSCGYGIGASEPRSRLVDDGDIVLGFALEFHAGDLVWRQLDDLEVELERQVVVSLEWSDSNLFCTRNSERAPPASMNVRAFRSRWNSPRCPSRVRFTASEAGFELSFATPGGKVAGQTNLGRGRRPLRALRRPSGGRRGRCRGGVPFSTGRLRFDAATGFRTERQRTPTKWSRRQRIGSGLNT